MIDPAKSKLAQRVTGPAGFWAAALAVDGERLYCGATDFAIYAYDARALPDQPAAVLKGHRSYVTALAFAPPARCLISGGLDRQVIGWKAGTETPAWTAPASLLRVEREQAEQAQSKIASGMIFIGSLHQKCHEQLQAGGLAFLRMELRGGHVVLLDGG